MRKIAVLDYFFEKENIELIQQTASDCGFEVDFYLDGSLPDEKLNDYEILYGFPHRSELREMQNLKWFHCSFAGVDIYAKPELYANPDCILSNASGAYGLTISEHVIMVTLMLFRNMSRYQEVIRDRNWVQRADNRKMRSIYGTSVTILGTGDIGTNVAQRMKAFGPKIIRGVRRSMTEADPAFDEIYTFDKLDDVLPLTDLLVMAVPSTPETIGILSKERIALLPENAVVVNVGRGTAIDEAALIEALNNERIAGAALDVVSTEPLPKDNPLWNAKNILLTPHCSGNMSLQYTIDENVRIFCRELRNYAAGKPNEHRVLFEKGY